MNKTYTQEEIVKGCFAIGLVIVNMFYRYFIAVKIWGYIAVKLFNAESIGMWKAFALASLISCFTINHKDLEFDKSKNSVDDMLSKSIKFSLALTFIWLTDWMFFA